MRIYWHNFCSNHPKLFKAIEKTLNKAGFELHLEFCPSGVCTDAYIAAQHKESPDAQHKEGPARKK